MARINVLPLILPGSFEEAQIVAKTNERFPLKSFPIIFLLTGGKFTWRGVGQDIPPNSRWLASASLLCASVASGFSPKAVRLDHCFENDDRLGEELTREWDNPNLFGNHDFWLYSCPPHPDFFWFKTVK